MWTDKIPYIVGKVDPSVCMWTNFHALWLVDIIAYMCDMEAKSIHCQHLAKVGPLSVHIVRGDYSFFFKTASSMQDRRVRLLTELSLV